MIFLRNESNRVSEKRQFAKNYTFKSNQSFRSYFNETNDEILDVIPKFMKTGTVINCDGLLPNYSACKAVFKIINSF